MTGGLDVLTTQVVDTANGRLAPERSVTSVVLTSHKADQAPIDPTGNEAAAQTNTSAGYHADPVAQNLWRTLSGSARSTPARSVLSSIRVVTARCQTLWTTSIRWRRYAILTPRARRSSRSATNNMAARLDTIGLADRWSTASSTSR